MSNPYGLNPHGPTLTDMATGNGGIIGIDAAHWQGVLPVHALESAGIRFAIVKAVHGLSVNPDVQFTRSFNALLTTRLHRSAYLWFTDADPIAQADNFFRVVEAAGYADRDLPLAVDFEEPSTRYRGHVLLDRLRECLARVHDLSGRAPLLYTGKWYWDQFVSLDAPDLVETYPLWHAQYPRAEVRDRRACGIDPPNVGKPALPRPWASRGVAEALWQFDGDGGCVLPNGVDADFNVADKERFARLLGRPVLADTDPAPAPSSAPDTLPSTPTSRSSQSLRAVREPIADLSLDSPATPLRAGEGEHTVRPEEPDAT